MATAGSIVIDLLLKSGSFETDSKRAAKNLDDLNKQAQIAGAAIGAAFVAGTTALAYFVKQSIDTMDEMSKLAQSTGTTVEAISSLAYAADLSGVSNQDLGAALSKLTKNMSDTAKGTGEAQAGFKALGISVTDANGNLKSSDAVLSEIAGKFASYKDGAEKTALAVNLFGKSGAQLIPLLNSGADGLADLEAEAKRLGITLDTDTAQAAEKFNDSLTRLEAVGKGFINRITAAALPALNGFTQALIEASTESDGLGESTGKLVNDSGLTSWVDAVAVGLARVADVAVFVAKTIDTVAGSFKAVASDVELALATMGKDNSGITEYFDPDAAKKQNEDYAAILANRNKIVEDANKKLADLQNYKGNRFEQAVLAGINAPPDAGTLPAVKTTAPRLPSTSTAKDQIDDGQKLIDQLQKQVDLTGQLTERQKLQIQIQQGYVTFQTQSQQDTATALADTLDFINEQNKAYDQTQKQLQQLSKVSQDTSDDMGQFAIQAARSIQSSLGDGLYDILSGNFDNIGQSFANTLLKMVADAEAAQLSKALFGDYDKSGQIGGIIGQAFGSLLGSSAISSTQTGSLAGITNVGPATGSLDGLSYAAFADGGYTGPGGRNDVAGVVHAGEYVINAQSTRKLGMGFLSRLNGYADGGYVGNPPSASGGPNVQVNVVNQSSNAVDASQGTARFDGEKYVIDILLKDKRKNGPVSRAFSAG